MIVIIITGTIIIVTNIGNCKKYWNMLEFVEK